MTEQNRVDKLVDDLARLGDYGGWEPPAQKENIDWFKPYGNIRFSHQKDELLVKRLEELVAAGADLKNKGYIIANVNNPALLKVALKLGADPNIPGKSGIRPIEKACRKKRSTIADILVSHPDFDFSQTGREGQNVLFMAIDSGRYKVANKIVILNPELALTRNNINSTIMMAVACEVAYKPKLMPTVLKFINSCLAYANSQNYDFSVNEINNKGDSIISRSPKVAEYITEKKVLDLIENLSKKEDTTRKIFKL